MTWGLKLGPSLHVKEIMKFEVQPHKTTLSNIDVVNEIQRIWPTFGLITPYKWQIEPNLHLGPRNDLRSQTWSESPRQRNYEIWGPATQDYFVEYRRSNEIQRIWPTFGLITPYKWQIEPNLHLGPRNDLRSQTWSESPRQRNYEIWGPATQDYFVEYQRS